MLIERLNQRLLEREAEGLRRQRRTAQGPCQPHLNLVQDDGQTTPRLAFCSNDYLGLAHHPALTAAWCEGAQLHGTGSGASHLVSGHHLAHQQLEDELARWFAPYIPGARCLTFSTGYMANLALLTALGGDDTVLFADKLNHASLVDGGLLAKAPLQRYPHADLDRLAQLLENSTAGIKLIVTDSVFSMDGDLADLPALLALAERFDAWLVIDDAHAFGVLGPQGEGSLGHFGLHSERLICMGTLGKAAGLSGAFVAAHPTIISWLIQSARPYIYTTAAPPALAHALCASLHLIAGEEGQQRRQHLQQLVAQLRTGLDQLLRQYPALGWQLMASHTAIQPLVVGDNHRALALSAALEAEGLWVPAIRPPTVPTGTARLRITLSAAHQSADLDRLLAALQRAAHTLSQSADMAPMTYST